MRVGEEKVKKVWVGLIDKLYEVPHRLGLLAAVATELFLNPEKFRVC